MDRVGFVGLGIMGMAMARNLLKSWSTTGGPEPLQGKGRTACRVRGRGRREEQHHPHHASQAAQGPGGRRRGRGLARRIRFTCAEYERASGGTRSPSEPQSVDLCFQVLPQVARTAYLGRCPCARLRFVSVCCALGGVRSGVREGKPRFFPGRHAAAIAPSFARSEDRRRPGRTRGFGHRIGQVTLCSRAPKLILTMIAKGRAYWGPALHSFLYRVSIAVRYTDGLVTSLLSRSSLALGPFSTASPRLSSPRTVRVEPTMASTMPAAA